MANRPNMTTRKKIASDILELLRLHPDTWFKYRDLQAQIPGNWSVGLISSIIWDNTGGIQGWLTWDTVDTGNEPWQSYMHFKYKN